MLFKLIVNGFSTEINDDLEALLDEITPLYKARYEEISEQSQKIIATIALNWDAISLKKLAQQSGYANNQLSPQLKRLIEEGWVESTPAYKAKGNAYSISERFFNIWFIMRMSTRREKQEIVVLSKFLECFYGEAIKNVASNHLNGDYQCEQDFIFGLALKESKMLDRKRRKQLENKMVLSENNIVIKNDYLKHEIERIKDKNTKNKSKPNSIDKYTELIDFNPNDGFDWIWIRKGLDLEDEQRHEEAMDCFDKAIELNPKDEYVWYWKGNCLRDMQRYEEALVCYDKAIELNPKDEYTWYWKGNCLRDMQRYEEALVCYDKAIELNPKNEYAWYWKGVCLQEMQHYKEALVCYDKAIELNPKDEYAWYWKGVCLQEMQRYEEALVCHDRAIELEPNNANCFNCRGWIKEEMSDYVGALDDFNKAIKIDPNNASHYYGRSWVKEDISDSVGAVDDLTKSIQINPNYSIAYNDRGYSYVKTQQYDLAEADFLKAIEFDNNNVNPKFHLQKLYRDRLGKISEAKKLFNEIGNSLETDKRFMQETLFELHNRNEGIAKKHLLQALQSIENELPKSTIETWYYFASISLNLNYGEWLLKILEEKGYDIAWSPYYTAIKALEIEKQDSKNGRKNAEIYLKNRAIEISEPARMIMEKMRKYM
jgi:tetratricopeptide (TPR) repeat protein